MRLRVPRPSPALLVAILALSLTMGGVSYAAAKLPRNSVGTPQLKAGAVTGWKVRNNTLTGRDVKEHTLKATGGQRNYIGTDFRPVNSSMTFENAGMGLVHTTVAKGTYRARLDLPEGARLRQLELFGTDDSPGPNLVLKLYKANTSIDEWELVTSEATFGTPGTTAAIIDLDPRRLVVNGLYTYVIEVEFTSSAPFASASPGELTLDGVLVKWSGAAG